MKNKPSPLRKYLNEYINLVGREEITLFYDRVCKETGKGRVYVRRYFWLTKNEGVNKPVLNTAKSPELDSLGSLKADLGLDDPFELPLSYEELYRPFILPEQCRNILNLSDIHLPYQSNQALSTAIKYGKEQAIDTVLLNGDVMDFYAISRFQKEKDKRNLKREIETGREFFTMLRKIFPSQTIIYKLGNHEDRWIHHLAQNSEDFIGIDDFTLSAVLRLKNHRIIIVDSKIVIHCGHLTILHGHELGKTLFSPVNPARGLYMRARASAIMGHCHQTSEHTGKDIRNKIYTCWSQGCLSELNPDYAPFNNYNHGFSHIKLKENGNFVLRNFRINDGIIM